MTGYVGITIALALVAWMLVIVLYDAWVDSRPARSSAKRWLRERRYQGKRIRSEDLDREVDRLLGGAQPSVWAGERTYWYDGTLWRRWTPQSAENGPLPPVASDPVPKPQPWVPGPPEAVSCAEKPGCHDGAHDARCPKGEPDIIGTYLEERIKADLERAKTEAMTRSPYCPLCTPSQRRKWWRRCCGSGMRTARRS